MVSIPQYRENRVAVDRTPGDYYKTSADADAFGAGVARATQRLSSTLGDFSLKMNGAVRELQQTRALELSNYIDELEKTELADPQNGYYSKQGFDAMRDDNDPTKGAVAVLNGIDRKILKKQQELGLTWGYGKQLAELTKTRKMNMLYRGATSHEMQQTYKWTLSTLEIANQSSIGKALNHRNDESELETIYGNGVVTILQKAKIGQWDEDTKNIEIAKYRSNFHSSIIQAFAQDGSLLIDDYFEKHKGELLPKDYEQCLSLKNHTDQKVYSKLLGDNLYEGHEDDPREANELLERKFSNKEINIDQYNATRSYLNGLYSRDRMLQNQEQDNLMDKMWDSVSKKIQNGQVPSEDDIPMGLNGRNWYQAKSAIDQLVSKGDVDTDNSAYLELYELSTTDAQKFANMNLAQYRPLLSDSDYKSFQKKQKDIKNMTPTQLYDTDKAIQSGLEALGLNNPNRKKSKAYINSANAYIRELELKQGKNMTREQVNEAMRDFTHNYGYKNKDGKASDLYIEGMNKQVGFMRNVINDLSTAEKLKGSPLTDEERYKVVAQRVSKTVVEDNREISEHLKSNYESYVRTPKEGDIWHGHRITSLYGPRKQPKPGASEKHQGVDLAYRYNEKFPAFEGGTVVEVGQNNSYGNYVDIKSADGAIHRYAHANSIAVSRGQKVTTGTYIGRAGNTGISTGPHLHYEKIVNGKSVDPLKKEPSAVKTANNNKGWAF